MLKLLSRTCQRQWVRGVVAAGVWEVHFLVLLLTEGPWVSLLVSLGHGIPICKIILTYLTRGLNSLIFVKHLESLHWKVQKKLDVTRY